MPGGIWLATCLRLYRTQQKHSPVAACGQQRCENHQILLVDLIKPVQFCAINVDDRYDLKHVSSPVTNTFLIPFPLAKIPQ